MTSTPPPSQEGGTVGAAISPVLFERYFVRRYTIKDLRRCVCRHGAKLVNESAGRWIVYQVEAPEGSRWEGGLSSLRVEWLKWDADHKSESIQDAIERLDSISLEKTGESEARNGRGQRIPTKGD
jgi:hypothetical protein